MTSAERVGKLEARIGQSFEGNYRGCIAKLLNSWPGRRCLVLGEFRRERGRGGPWESFQMAGGEGLYATACLRLSDSQKHVAFFEEDAQLSGWWAESVQHTCETLQPRKSSDTKVLGEIPMMVLENLSYRVFDLKTCFSFWYKHIAMNWSLRTVFFKTSTILPRQFVRKTWSFRCNLSTWIYFQKISKLFYVHFIRVLLLTRHALM